MEVIMSVLVKLKSKSVDLGQWEYSKNSNPQSLEKI